MDFLLFLATFVLFFVLTPGVVLSLPPKGSKLVTALVHALLFAILLTLFMECFKSDPNPLDNISTRMVESAPLCQNCGHHHHQGVVCSICGHVGQGKKKDGNYGSMME